MEREINVYNNNMPSMLSMFYRVAEGEGIKVNKIENLESLKNSPLTLIVPTGPATNWSAIKNYIDNNPKTKIWIMDVSTSRQELESRIGKNENVEYLVTKETNNQKNLYDKMFDKLGVKI